MGNCPGSGEILFLRIIPGLKNQTAFRTNFLLALFAPCSLVSLKSRWSKSPSISSYSLPGQNRRSRLRGHWGGCKLGSFMHAVFLHGAQRGQTGAGYRVDPLASPSSFLCRTSQARFDIAFVFQPVKGNMHGAEVYIPFQTRAYFIG